MSIRHISARLVTVVCQPKAGEDNDRENPSIHDRRSHDPSRPITSRHVSSRSKTCVKGSVAIAVPRQIGASRNAIRAPLVSVQLACEV